MEKRHMKSILLAGLLLSLLGLGLFNTAGAQEEESMETFWAADTLHLKVDLALPMWDSTELWPETAKEGWTIWGDPIWADMYTHEMVCLEDIGGSGINACLTAGTEGQAGLHVKGLCRCSLAGGCPPTGSPQGGPIANSWYYAVDWAGPDAGDVLLLLTGLPAGEYELISYHNRWEACSLATRNCLDCDWCGTSSMPPIASITANPLPAEPLPQYGHWPLPPGTGAGVSAIQNAYDVPVTLTYLDDEVSQSLIKFHTDGSEVLIIYEAPADYSDCFRPGRQGGRGILNAFELIQLEPDDPCPCPGDITDTSGLGEPDGKVDIGDLNALLMEMIRQYPDCGRLFELVPLPPGFECMDISDTGGFGPPDGRVDIGDLNAILIAMDGIRPAYYDPYYEVPCFNDGD